MKKIVTINVAQKRPRQKINIVQPDRDISRKKDGLVPDTPGIPLVRRANCIPTDPGDYTIIDDCAGLLNPEGVLYAWDPPVLDIPAIIVVQWTYGAPGNPYDDFTGDYQFGSPKNVQGGFCRTKALQPGMASEPVPIPDDTIEYSVEGSIANWVSDPDHALYGDALNLYFQWRRWNTVLSTHVLVTSSGSRHWTHGIVASVPPAGTNNIRIKTATGYLGTNVAWDNIAVSYAAEVEEEDPTSTIIPPRLGRVYSQVAIRISGDTYALCIDADNILQVMLDGISMNDWTFDGDRTITLPIDVSSDSEVLVRFIA